MLKKLIKKLTNSKKSKPATVKSKAKSAPVKKAVSSKSKPAKPTKSIKPASKKPAAIVKAKKPTLKAPPVPMPAKKEEKPVTKSAPKKLNGASKDNKPTTNPAALPTPIVKVVLCGPHSVYWLPRDVDVHPKILQEGVHEKERELSNVLKVPQKRTEFLRARWLQRRVLKNRDPLLRRPSGDPAWAEGCVASISHKDGHVIFCKAVAESHYGLGIDIEKINGFNTDLASKICVPEELDRIDRVCALSRMSRQEVLALIFSYKEAVFKSHFPIGRKMFGFHDVIIDEIAFERREILARALVSTCQYVKEGQKLLGFYNWLDVQGEKYTVVVAEERKPLIIDKNLKEELLAEEAG